MHNLFLLFFLVYFIRTEKGFEFLSIKEVQATCFSSTYKLIMRLLIHGQGGQKHALEVMSFHPLRGGLAIFSSIYKLVTECFNHSKEGYNMLSRLQVFIHGEAGLHIFASIHKLVTDLFNHRHVGHRQEGYDMLSRL
jgi:hypothetical protein